jgi:hypothetical protein
MHNEPATSRGAALAALSISTAILVAAAWMTPDPRGHGSHEQLGLPPCGLVATWGLPCPTCGMCTSFSLAIRGRLFAALQTQPAGLALFTATVFIACTSSRSIMTRRAPRFGFMRWSALRWGWVAAVLAMGWVYKLAVWSAK